MIKTARQLKDLIRNQAKVLGTKFFFLKQGRIEKWGVIDLAFNS